MGQQSLPPPWRLPLCAAVAPPRRGLFFPFRACGHPREGMCPLVFASVDGAPGSVTVGSRATVAGPCCACSAAAGVAEAHAVGANPPVCSLLLALPRELFARIAPRLLDSASPVARLACAAKGFAEELRDEQGRLRVGSIVTSRLRSAVEGLTRANLAELEVLRVDLAGERREKILRHDVDLAIRRLADGLPGAARLRVLAVRLATFDVSMERLRLGRDSWQALAHGIGGLARHGRLRRLELSSVTIKASWATAAELGDRRTLTFLEALGQLTFLEELALTHGEIFGSTAQLLAPALVKMERLRKLDLTRNHISKQVMASVREVMPPKVELCGTEQQTFCFY